MNDSRARYRVGVDVGGTFTDLVAYSADGVLHSAKVPSLPGEQWRGVLDALASLGIAPGSIHSFVHGTTIATNALLERKGARTGLITTEGFRDLLEIGKGRRLVGGLFDPQWRRPAPIVPRDRRLEVPERIAADGAVVRPLDGFDFDALAAALRDKAVEAVAVALLNSYVSDAHEQAVARELARRLPGVAICESAALSPERGEFERTSTAVLNAYLTPVMRAYLAALEKALLDRDISAPVNIMGSNGGAMTLAAAADRCAGTFLSGPVGGVTGAVRVAANAGVEDIITFDMGGTSTDVALVYGLAPRMSHDNQIDAWPLKMPQLDIHTIGAGGGSIVWIQPDGTLGVGPQSAGAVPGPACYGRGGTEPTVSDANLLLGRLPVGRTLAGGLVLDSEKARNAFRSLRAGAGGDRDHFDYHGAQVGGDRAHVDGHRARSGADRDRIDNLRARPGGDRDRVARRGENAAPETQVEHARGDGDEDLVALASAALRIAVARMAGAVREVSVHRGFDPRDFTLLGFGGAGPMHVMAVAEELGISRVLVPRLPGHLSALGQMLADLRRDTVAAWGGRVSELSIDALKARTDAMRDDGTRKLEADGMPRDRQRHEFTLDVRYTGQSFTLPIRWTPEDADWAPLRAAFDARHEGTFGYADPENDIEIVNVRLVSIGEVDKPAVEFAPAGGGEPVIERRQAWFGAWRETPVIDRERLSVGWRIEGPAIFEESGGTTVVPPGWTAEVDTSGALMCEGSVRW